MDSFVIAALLPLAQATERPPQAGEVAGQMFQGLVSGPSLPLALLGLAIAIVIQILASWIAAKVVVGDPKGSLGNAFKLWLLYVVLGIGVGLLLGVAIPTFAIAKNSLALIGVLGGTALLLIALTFLLPMKIFGIGLLRALAFLVLSTVLVLAAQAGILRAQGKPALGSVPQFLETMRSAEKRDQFIKQLTAGRKATGLDADLDRLAQPAERAKPFPERQDNLRKVYDELEARQKALPPGNAKALAEYERLRARYEELVRVLKADYAASKAQGTAP